MIFVRHRVNHIEEIDELEASWGAEIDIRSFNQTKGKLILSHEPWSSGPDFEDWLQHFSRKQIRGPLILNTKEDGLEEKILETLNKYGIKNFFFLDTAVPTLVKYILERKVPSFAVRVSCYEGMQLAQSLPQSFDWIWLDCFQKRPWNEFIRLKSQSKAKICLVSPELQGGTIDLISEFISLARVSDAICTKFPKKWQETLK